MKDFDLIIIGGGSAGLVAADMAVQFGARVALVEKHRIGGDCTWSGCIPSKTLLKAAKVLHHMRTAEQYGLSTTPPEVDLAAVMARVHQVIDQIYQEETPEVLRSKGIQVYEGAARFLDSHALLAGDETLSARHFLVATGAHPYTPPIDGLDKVPYLTYENLWTLDQLPHRLLVVGGGPVGSEMAQAFQRLGSQVTLVTGREQLLPKDDPEAAEVLANVFAQEGIDVRFNARAHRAWQSGDDLYLAAGGHELVGDALLIATGRHPNVAGLDLEKAGVAFSQQGIRVDNTLRTTRPHIYAAGDCTGGPQFTHYAGWQAAMAVRNMLLPGAWPGVMEHVPWTTFTDPEVAHAGMTEAQARQKHGDSVRVYQWDMERVDRAHTDGSTAGFVRVVFHRNNRLLGATIVGAHAGESIHEWILALDQNLKVSDLSSPVHVYPTYSIANMQAAADIRIQQLQSGVSGRAIRALRRFTNR